jgi:hypothetical protein
MSTITWPTDIQIGGADYGIEFDVQINIMRNGAIQTYGLPGARWMSTISFEPEVEQMQRPRIEALIAQLEGGANRLAMHHHGRPVPNGTLRGSPTVNNTAAAGAKSIVLTNVNGTVKRGDLLGILGQLVMVTADASPSGGTMTVNFVAPLRNAATVGTSVTWNKPAINWIPRTSIAGPFPYRPSSVRPGISLELVEAY